MNHLFSLNMRWAIRTRMSRSQAQRLMDRSWTSTSKSVVKSNFFLQMPRIWRRFWIQIVVSVVVLVSDRLIRRSRTLDRSRRE
jgi:hypothetical protein